MTLTASNNPSGTLRLGRGDEIHQQFKARYDELWPHGWRLRFLSTYNLDGARITAAWRQTKEPEIWVHSWEYADLRARYDVLWQQGWRLKLFDRFTV